LKEAVRLTDLPKALGPWEFNNVFRDVRVAYKWGLEDPQKFWEKPEKLQALMIAYIEAEDAMQSYEQINSKQG
jgi:hypothetical protein